MTEISYQLFDKVSRLPIRSLTDGFVREMAKIQNKSCSDIFNEVKSEVKKAKIEYFIKRNSSKIVVIAGGSRFACQGEYFDNYNEALKKIEK